MSLEDNKRIVRDWLETNYTSPGYVEAHAHDDIELWFVADPETFPRAASNPMDKAGLIAALERVRELFPEPGGFKFEIRSMTAEDNRVAVESTARAVGKDTGKKITNRGCAVYEIKDGKVFRISGHEDTAYVMSQVADEAEYITPWKTSRS